MTLTKFGFRNNSESLVRIHQYILIKEYHAVYNSLVDSVFK